MKDCQFGQTSGVSLEEIEKLFFLNSFHQVVNCVGEKNCGHTEMYLFKWCTARALHGTSTAHMFTREY